MSILELIIRHIPKSGPKHTQQIILKRGQKHMMDQHLMKQIIVRIGPRDILKRMLKHTLVIILRYGLKIIQLYIQKSGQKHMM